MGSLCHPPPPGGQRVGGGVTAPPRLPLGSRGWVVGSLRHLASPRPPPLRDQRVGGGVTAPPCLPLVVRGCVVWPWCWALLGRPLLSLCPAGPLGVGPGTQFSSDQFYVHRLCARSMGCVETHPRTLLCWSLSHTQLFAIPRTVTRQAPLSVGFSGLECWSRLPSPSPGDLPHPGLERRSAWQQILLQPSHWGSPK